ncbi:MAG: DUF3179 domain-containing protein [Dehalococcoidia bacterium]|nr:DUF3179 domain-containing protein [Dehalococcoidia bacterium]
MEGTAAELDRPAVSRTHTEGMRAPSTQSGWSGASATPTPRRSQARRRSARPRSATSQRPTWSSACASTETQAYPERILAWHGVAQDHAGGTDIVLFHCLPCGGAAAYRQAASDGQSYAFGIANIVTGSRQIVSVS